MFLQERAAATKMFDGDKGEELIAQLLRQKTFAADAANGNGADAEADSVLTEEQKAKIRAAIANASTTEELNRLEAALQSGKVPKDLL